MTTTAATKTRALCVATRCTSVDQFVAMFHRFCGDDQTFFVATATSRPIGLETAFSIQLADKQPVLRGLCIVLDAWATSENRYRRPGIRLGIKRLTAESQGVFDRLRAAARPAAGPEATPWPGAAPRALRPRTRPPAFSLRTGVTPPSVRVPLGGMSPHGDLPPVRATPLPQPERPPVVIAPALPELPELPDPVEVTRFRIALHVDATPPSVEDVEFKPTQLVPRTRAEPRLISAPPAGDGPDEPALIVDRPIAADDGAHGPGDDDDDLRDPGAERVTERVTAEPDPAAIEARAPGSTLVLPANPLQNLSDESLEGFVDCTLYEEAVNVFHPGIDDRGWSDGAEPAGSADLAAAPRRDSVPAMPFDAAPELTVREIGGTESLAVAAAASPQPPPGYLAPPSFDPSFGPSFEPRDALAIAGGSQPLPLRGSSDSMPPYTAAPPTGSWPPYAPVVASGAWPSYTQPPYHQPPPSGPWPVVPVELGYLTPPPGSPPITTLVVARGAGIAGPAGLADWRRWLLIGGTAVVAIVLAFLLARLARGSVAAAPAAPIPAAPKSASRTPPAPVAPRAASVLPAAHVDAADADREESEDEQLPPPGAVPIFGSGPCRFTVTAAPAGSLVRLDEDPLGASPLMVEASCNNHKLDVSHARYQTVTRWISLAAERQPRIELSLPRPVHAVAITSSPPGAAVVIDGRRVGTTPAAVQLPGFTRVNLTLTKPGFRSVTRRIYSKVAQDRVAVKLAK